MGVSVRYFQRFKRRLHADPTAAASWRIRPGAVGAAWGTVAIMIDSNDLGGTAEATVSNLMFSRAGP